LSNNVKTQETTSDDNETVFLVSNDPVMKTALEILTVLNNTNKIIIKGKGETCYNAVSVANILTENILKENSEVKKITLGSVIQDDGYMLSTIEIIIIKYN